MKIKILFLFILVIMASCATLLKIEPEETYYGIDFRRFAEKDFLFSTEKYTDSHLLLGMISMEIYSGGNYLKSDGILKWVYGTLSIDSALDRIYNKTIEYKGDAFVDLKIEYIYKTNIKGKEGSTYSNPPKVPGIKISGNIIKRTNKL